MTNKLFFLTPALLVAAIVPFISGCKGCGCSEDLWLAYLKESRGAVERDFAASVNQWKPAELEARFVVGDGVRARKDGTAVLQLNEGSLALLKPMTTIRFATQIPGRKQAAFKVETGTAELVVQSDQFELNTGIGTARLARGTRMNISSDGATLNIEVLIGRASFVSTNGEEVQLNPGDDIDIDIGVARIVRVPEESPPDTAAKGIADTAPSDSAASTDAADAGAASPDLDKTSGVSGSDEPVNSPDYADFSVAGGSSFTVHSPTVPVAIQLRTSDKCPEGAMALIDGNKALGRGNDHVNLLFSRGSSTYRIFCLNGGGRSAGKPTATGRVTVLEDAGTRKLPKSAPTSRVDADGRSYRIMYANQLPAVMFRWPGAPTALQFELNVITDGKPRTLSTKKPEYLFKSGELKEGTHRLKFTVPGTTDRSRTATITIAFENSAAKASIREPENASFSGGQKVSVSGTALPGWTVSVKNGSIATDDQQRFSGNAATESGYRALVIQLNHPKGGVHYYLRYTK